MRWPWAGTPETPSPEKRWARQSLSQYDPPGHESFSGLRRRTRVRPDAETPVRIRALATLGTSTPLRNAPHLNPPLTRAPIPYAVGPHTVGRAWFMASRWSAPLYERPGRHGPRLHGSAWVDGRRDGSTLAHATARRHSRTAPPPSRSLSAPAGGSFSPWLRPSRSRPRAVARCGPRGTALGPKGQRGRAQGPARAVRGPLIRTRTTTRARCCGTTTPPTCGATSRSTSAARSPAMPDSHRRMPANSPASPSARSPNIRSAVPCTSMP